MAVVTMKQLLEAGVHFGHQTSRWNPKMQRFIHGERSGIYIIDLQQTLSCIESAYGFTRDLAANGGRVLFVGTKRQAQDPIRSYAEKCGMPYVNQRWLGGMLTNFQTISKRVAKMQEYQRMRDSGEFEVMPKKEALQWAYAGLDWLEETHRLRDQPWSGIQLQAYIAFDRILNERKMKGVNHLVRQKCALWLATGGGPKHVSPLTSQSYRDYLRLPAEDREPWILNRMSRF